uniref:Ribosomal protein L32 n=1 Tax=Udotea flabellum TaxID=170437 RepID=A0A386B1X6_9CHLO|nr:ribosomal protein L32 [Udotea flabellum]AYC65709.1 ribosomal protein L32 [Udotea flabellum]
MAVPKKRISKSKSRSRKTFWKKKAFSNVQKILLKKSGS